MKDISLVTIGDRSDFDSFRKLHRERRGFSNSRISYRAVSYKDLLKGKIPRVKNDKILFFLFFPYEHWDKNIETKRYRGIYGNELFYKKFLNFFKAVEAAIMKHFSGKEIFFVNSPLLCARYRDKMVVKKLLANKKIPTPKLCSVSNVKDVYDHIARDRSVFIKVRYGSMGKGITYISPSAWKTNFVFRERRILSRKSDYGWRFRTIAKREAFLEKLFKADTYKEEAVESFLSKGKKFDLRVYVFYGKVLFIYPRSAGPENITTNITQGGKGEYPVFLRALPRRVIERIRGEATRAAAMLGLNFAGIDIIVGRNLRNIYVIDINVFPGFPRKKIFNLSRHLVKQLKNRATF